MKIYFAGSIRGGRDDREIYLKIIEHLKKYGEVLTEHIGDTGLSSEGEKNLTDTEIYLRDLNWIKSSDVIVAEVTNPSFGVGYELGRSEILNKQVLCLYREVDNRRLSAMIAGNSKMKIKKYLTLEDAYREIDSFFA